MVVLLGHGLADVGSDPVDAVDPAGALGVAGGGAGRMTKVITIQ